MKNDNKEGIKCLDKFIGTWNLSGPKISGEVRFEWFEGEHFLLQHVDLVFENRRIKGVEYIEYDKKKEQCKSNYFDIMGNHFTYVWELKDKEITIWFGNKDSSNLFRGKFDEQFKNYSGAWEWPGGGYTINAKKVK